jgi:hypothetical protein
MATDGDINFTTYTREQLDSAVSRMDHTTPRHKEAIRAER